MSEEIDFSGIADMIGELLSNDEGKQQIQNVLSMLGGEPAEKTAPGMATGGINPDNIELILKLNQVMSVMNDPKSGKQTAFLHSLKELLRPERREKVDSAIKFLSIGKAIKAFKKIEGV